MTITTSGLSRLDGATLNNHGAATWSGAGGIFASNGASINNLAGATFNAQGTIALLWDTSKSGPQPVFNNAGAFTSSGAASFIDFQPAFNNTGTVEAQAGTLSLGGGGYGISTSTGTFLGDPGTRLQLYGSQNLSATASVIGDVVALGGPSTLAGPYTATGGTITIGGTVNFTGPVGGLGNYLDVSGTANFSPAVPAPLTTGTLTVEPGGTLTGTDSFTASGVFTLSDGSSVSGPFTIYAYGGMSLSPAGYFLQLNGVALYNHGTATWTGGPGIFAANGATINNLAGATFNAQGNAELVWDTSKPGPAPAFTNAGAFIRSGSTGATDIQIAFNRRHDQLGPDRRLAWGDDLLRAVHAVGGHDKSQRRDPDQRAVRDQRRDPERIGNH
jgi:hypothetical protein